MSALNLVNFSIDVLNEGTSLFSQGWTLGRVKFHEELNYFPSIELVLNPALGVDSNKGTLLPIYKDLEIKINVVNTTSLSYNLGVQFIRFSDGLLSITGKACKHADMVECGSAFLGTDLQTAIQSLNIRKSVENLDKITGRFYQLDETRLSCLMKLLKGRNPNSVALINNSKIAICNPAKSPTQLKPFMSPTSIKMVVRNMSISENAYAEASVGDMFNYTYAGINAIGVNNPEFASNYIKNLKYSYPLNLTAIATYENYIDYSIGDYMELKMVNLQNVRSALIIGTDTIFEGNGDITKHIQLGGTGV